MVVFVNCVIFSLKKNILQVRCICQKLINFPINRNTAQLDGYVVTKSDRLVSSGYSGFLPHKDHPNANGANEHD